MTGFVKGSLDLTEEKWSDVERYNECLDRLYSRRKPEVLVVGPLVGQRLPGSWPCSAIIALSRVPSRPELHMVASR